MALHAVVQKSSLPARTMDSRSGDSSSSVQGLWRKSQRKRLRWRHHQMSSCGGGGGACMGREGAGG